jgi:hypothetical protein
MIGKLKFFSALYRWHSPLQEHRFVRSFTDFHHPCVSAPTTASNMATTAVSSATGLSATGLNASAPEFVPGATVHINQEQLWIDFQNARQAHLDLFYAFLCDLTLQELQLVASWLRDEATQLRDRMQHVWWVFTTHLRSAVDWLTVDLRDRLNSLCAGAGNFCSTLEALNQLLSFDTIALVTTTQNPIALELVFDLSGLVSQASESIEYREGQAIEMSALIRDQEVTELNRLCSERMLRATVKLPDSVSRERRGGFPALFELMQALAALQQGDHAPIQSLADRMGCSTVDPQMLTHYIVSLCAPAVLSADDSLEEMTICDVLGRLLAWLQASQLRGMNRAKQVTPASSVLSMMLVFQALCPQTSDENVLERLERIARVSAEWSAFAQSSPFAFFSLDRAMLDPALMAQVLHRMLAVTAIMNREEGLLGFTPTNPVGWLENIQTIDPTFAAWLATTLATIFRTGTTQMPMCAMIGDTAVAPPRGWLERLICATIATQVCHSRTTGQSKSNPLTCTAVQRALHRSTVHTAFADVPEQFQRQVMVMSRFLLDRLPDGLPSSPLLSNYELMESMCRPRPSAPSQEVYEEQLRSSTSPPTTPSPTPDAAEPVYPLLENASAQTSPVTPVPRCTANPPLDGSARVTFFPPATLGVSQPQPQASPPQRQARRQPQHEASPPSRQPRREPQRQQQPRDGYVPPHLRSARQTPRQ